MVNLGDTRSHVELATTPTHTPTAAQLAAVESEINRLIREALPVRTVAVSATDASERPDSLPADYVGTHSVVRTVHIADVDANPCCGTHVTNLAHLQAVKLLHTDRIRGNNTRLFFLVGGRVLGALGSAYAVSRDLTAVLSGGQETFVETAGRLVKESKGQAKVIKTLLKEIAGYVAVELAARVEASGHAEHHREDGDMDYLLVLAGLLKEKGVLVGARVVMLSAGEKAGGGPMMVLGVDEERVNEVVKGITGELDGVKGGGKGRWQGRVKTWKGLEKAWEVVGKVGSQ
ncbi:Threonyl/alanyl tRNA synthetase [Jimgerdemannia flammicorona]|uniref:Threonyl/alanyl tRNA synthetase n=1 Tax=Jimgerdemannia flammicorona TaxID=994334 RepID=A0A433D7T0_9FUNG|nr:Threonyl/alanyl tRNA synthetase [Jimgerdemannia flammicorona]